MSKSDTPTVVLVHGGFVDGSGWQGVYEHLRKDGHSVTVVQNPTLSLADDVAVTKRAIDAATEPVILVGHSYGGVVITEAGTHPRLRRSSTSPPSRRTRASRSTPSSPTRRPARPCRRFCRRRTGFCSSTAKSSMLHSRVT